MELVLGLLNYSKTSDTTAPSRVVLLFHRTNKFTRVIYLLCPLYCLLSARFPLRNIYTDPRKFCYSILSNRRICFSRSNVSKNDDNATAHCGIDKQSLLIFIEQKEKEMIILCEMKNIS